MGIAEAQFAKLKINRDDLVFNFGSCSGCHTFTAYGFALFGRGFNYANFRRGIMNGLVLQFVHNSEARGFMS